MSGFELAFDARNIVGESPVWSIAEQRLYWVDIVGSRIHCFNPTDGRHQSWPTPELPTSIGLRRDGGFIVGLRRRVVLWSPGGEFENLATPEPDLPDNRLNEGVVAPDGSFWVGTMQDNIDAAGLPRQITANTGAIYRIGPDGSVRQLTDRNFGITNTMLWPDDGSFITTDTLKNALYSFGLRDGVLVNRRPLGPSITAGLPDGSALDRNGVIYNARVGGGAVARLELDGTPLPSLAISCTQPTSCAFGGDNLRKMFVTSARFGINAQTLEENPSEGGLFSIEQSSSGLPPNLFGS